MKTHRELKLTKAQHRNIAKLTVFVRDKVAPPKFDIKWFFQGGEDSSHPNDGVSQFCPMKKDYHQCGTSACFAGYAILAGIKPRKEEKWGQYLCRVFGLGDYTAQIYSDIYSLLFDHKHKNSKIAAVKRGAYFLTNGIPQAFNLREWETPRSFKPDWAKIEALASS